MINDRLKEMSEIYEMDWSSYTAEEKRKLIETHINYVKLSRQAVGASGSYISNIRSLLLMLTVVIVMMLLDSDNKSIILAMSGLQFLKTLFSRLFEVNLLNVLEIAKNDMFRFMNKDNKKL